MCHLTPYHGFKSLGHGNAGEITIPSRPVIGGCPAEVFFPAPNVLAAF